MAASTAAAARVGPETTGFQLLAGDDRHVFALAAGSDWTVRDAALRAIVRTGDTTLIVEVEGLLDQEELPAHVLAWLGARGSARALDRLAAHLDDPRAAVRGWVVSAFRQTLARANRAVAVQRLKGALESVTHPDTREAVSDLLRQLEKP